MKLARSFPTGCGFALVSIALGFCLTLGSAFYQRASDPTCHGNLSAGFPLPFVCDEAGGSPIDSWGRIDLFELFGTNLRVFLLDFLLYGALLSLAWIVILGLFRKGLAHVDNFRWGILLCVGYIVAFLFIFMAFQASQLDFRRPFPRTPTPVIFTPTPLGTALPPLSSPSPSP
ncbi:MAG TPA: hypothetical protein VK249_00850 [Anaerolineales bacterium]|nr:hypothetical protein [Anaerolineales bacterium]